MVHTLKQQELKIMCKIFNHYAIKEEATYLKMVWVQFKYGSSMEACLRGWKWTISNYTQCWRYLTCARKVHQNQQYYVTPILVMHTLLLISHILALWLAPSGSAVLKSYNRSKAQTTERVHNANTYGCVIKIWRHARKRKHGLAHFAEGVEAMDLVHHLLMQLKHLWHIWILCQGVDF